MKYQNVNMGSYHLHLIHTKNFKTISVDINFRRVIQKEEITIRNLLKSILIDSSLEYKTERELVKALENLYDIKIYSTSTRLGNYSNLSFRMSFLNEKYTKEGMNEKSIRFLIDLLLKPNVENASFQEDVLSKQKVKLENDLASLKDNKTKYSIIQLLSSYKEEVYSYNPYGYLEDLDKITPQNLYQYYQSMLQNDFIDVFVVGDFDEKEIKEIFKEHFLIKTFKKEGAPLILKDRIPRKRVKTLHEVDDVNQTKLTILLLLNKLTDFERRYVLRVFNEMLGGSSNSLLFDIVREKNSLCYYINASSKSYDNLMIIYSGIDKDKIPYALKLIKKCLKILEKGNFEDSFLTSAKETIIASIESMEDSQRGIISNYYAKVLVESDDFDERKKQIQTVSREDIMKLSSKIKMDTILLLEKEDIENESNPDE